MPGQYPEPSADSAAVCDDAMPAAAFPMFDLCTRIGFSVLRARSIIRRRSSPKAWQTVL